MPIWEIRAELKLKADNIEDAIEEIKNTPLNNVKTIPNIIGLIRVD